MDPLSQTLRDPRVRLSLLQSFLLGLPRVFTVTATSTLFFIHAGADSLPLAYALSAGLVAAVGYARGAGVDLRLNGEEE